MKRLADSRWQEDVNALEALGFLDEAEELRVEEDRRDAELARIALERYLEWLRKRRKRRIREKSFLL